MYAINSEPLSALSIKTILPPNQSKIPITLIPKNSLIGEAKFCLLESLLACSKKRSVEDLNLETK